MSKFKVGDKVRYIGNDHFDHPEYYPTIGTIGKIITALDDDPDCYIQWPNNSTSGNDEHWCSTDDIELVEDVDMTNEEIRNNYDWVSFDDKGEATCLDMWVEDDE